MRSVARAAQPVVAGCTAAALLVSPAIAEEPSAPAKRQAAPASIRTITLATGDVERLPTFADGRQGAVIDNDTDSWQITGLLPKGATKLGAGLSGIWLVGMVVGTA
ncbi:hypothetical protein ACGFNP_52145 [Nonomuraea sp. NPDC049269]|uniref:hypothetical protein n=1 Tax=Nonomuraea sp. NPDC049269 TaxID=3364349 RepID=UPI00371AD577